MIYRNYWTMMTSEDYDIMTRKGTAHRDLYKVQHVRDVGIMLAQVRRTASADRIQREIRGPQLCVHNRYMYRCSTCLAGVQS